VTEVALKHLSLGDLLSALLERIVEIVEADTAAILLIEPGSGELTVRATVGLDPSTAVGIPIGAGLAGRVASERRSRLVPDLSQVKLVSPLLRNRGVNSLVAIPLIVEDEVIGVVHAGSEAFAQFTEEDARLLELMADRIAFAVNQAALRDAQTAAQERLQILGEAGTLLGSSLDVARTLEQLGALAAGRVADWCAIHLVDDQGQITLSTVAHADRAKQEWARTGLRRGPREPRAPTSVLTVLETGEPLLFTEMVDAQPGSLEAAEGVHTGMVVPLVARSRALGAISFVRGETQAKYTEADLELALDLARRAAIAIDNAQLYRAAEERAQATRVLESVGDGVFLVDRTGIVRTWNRAAASATGLRSRDVVDRPAAEAIPGWLAIVQRVPVAALGGAPRAESLPLDVGRRELWLSIHGVAVPDGVVYAFRDLTEDRALDTMRTEFVSTVSHELRTPLAAIYGAAMTLRRSDVALDERQRGQLLDVVSSEADRLARTVNDILWAARLDTETLYVDVQGCDPLALAQDVVAAQRAHLDRAHELTLTADGDLPLVSGDPDKVGRILINLIDNGIKYSPDGGRVDIAVRRFGSHVRFSVADQGLGVPQTEQRRVFEKFYRLDPHMTRGVGGTGLGLYICRELARRMEGRIWVDSAGVGRGSTFHVELPLASG
jgi:PAS domain S-box-containing protein